MTYWNETVLSSTTSRSTAGAKVSICSNMFSHTTAPGNISVTSHDPQTSPPYRKHRSCPSESSHQVQWHPLSARSHPPKNGPFATWKFEWQIVVEKTSIALRKLIWVCVLPKLMLVRSWFGAFTLFCRNPLVATSVPAWRLKYSAPETGEAYQIWVQWAANFCPVRISPTQQTGLLKALDLPQNALENLAEKSAVKWGIRSSSCRETRLPSAIVFVDDLPLWINNWLVLKPVFGAPNISQLGSSTNRFEDKTMLLTRLLSEHLTTIWKIDENWGELRMSYHPQVSRSGRHPAISPQRFQARRWPLGRYYSRFIYLSIYLSESIYLSIYLSIYIYNVYTYIYIYT